MEHDDQFDDQSDAGSQENNSAVFSSDEGEQEPNKAGGDLSLQKGGSTNYINPLEIHEQA